MPYGHPCQPFPLADAANRAALSRHSLAGLGTRLAAVEEEDDDDRRPRILTATVMTT